MPLKFIAPPNELLRIYQQALIDLRGEQDIETELHHLPVNSLDLAALANGATLRDAVPAGSRFFAKWGGGPPTSCEMAAHSSSKEPELRSYADGDQLAIVFARIFEALHLDRIQGMDVELHFLSIPGIHLEALHLVSKGKDLDLVLPVLSEYPQLAPNVVLDGDTFVARAREIAAARLGCHRPSRLSS